MDQTVVATLNSVLGNTKVNTLRVGWTQEDVAFAQPCFNGNGRDQAACEPTLRSRPSPISRTTPPRRASTTPIQIEDTFSWFMPSKHGDHDIKFGAQCQYSSVADNFTQDNMNGTFSFGLSNAPFNADEPAHVSGSVVDSRPGAGGSFNKATYFAAFVQDKWKLNNRLTVTLGVRYDLEVIPVPRSTTRSSPAPDDYPVDKNNFQPRVGLAYDVDGTGVGRAAATAGSTTRRTSSSSAASTPARCSRTRSRATSR